MTVVCPLGIESVVALAQPAQSQGLGAPLLVGKELLQALLQLADHSH